MEYKHLEIEKKWQKFWQDNKTYYCDVNDDKKPKFYALDMFPYPSGDGLHVGHPRGYTASDVIARFKRMQGFNVLHPIGWDAFGLPAEQYALKTGTHPAITIKKNSARFKEQLMMLGLSYDWDKELSTTDPSFYKWTQWIFKKLYQKGLAYIAMLPVNFCPELGTVLSNEEVIDGKSEIGGFPVYRKMIRQWALKISSYSERLIEDLSLLDWPESTIQMQKNWIGKSLGAEVDFKVVDSNIIINVFTTRVDTLYGCTYIVISPEHQDILRITAPDYKQQVENYILESSKKNDLERTELNKEKTGVFSGSYAINPINGKKVPIYVGDYVLASYGSGAVMAVPAHDSRDYQFAKKYHLEMIPVIESNISEEAYLEDGIHINSQSADGLLIEGAKEVILAKLVASNLGRVKTNYKLRDWIFSRQRFWGEPIPVIHLEDGTIALVDDQDLPLVLPDVKEFKPSGTGESPLINCKEFIDVEYHGQKGQRESNTMPQWAGSCWYYLRYLDNKNDHELASKKILDKWLPVDLYIGGSEHAVGHLIYARFWHKFLYDIGVVSSKEPFKKVFHQGMILGENSEKMSKSRGNVINPDPLVIKYGADSLRLYEMFMGPLDAYLPWSDSNFEGCRRFLERVYRLVVNPEYLQKFTKVNDHSLDKVYHKTVEKVTNDIEKLQFNTAISQLMVIVNEFYKAPSIYQEYFIGFIKMLAPFAPHLASEIYQMLGNEDVLDYQTWPEYDPQLLVDDQVDIAIQVNGKVRGVVRVNSNALQEEVELHAMNLTSVSNQLEGKTVVKIIYVKNRIFNIVCK